LSSAQEEGTAASLPVRPPTARASVEFDYNPERDGRGSEYWETMASRMVITACLLAAAVNN